MKNTETESNTNKHEIKDVLICGLGGVGCVCASKIYDSNLATLKILVDEKRYKYYSENKTTFNNKEYNFDLILSRETSYKADLIIIATKADGLDEAINNIKNFVKKETIIISVLNGINSEEKIAEQYGWNRVLISFYIGNSCIREDRKIMQDGNYQFVIGTNNENNKNKLSILKNFFERIGLKYAVSNHIMERYWKKFMVNVGLNQLCAVHNLTFKELKQNPQLIKELKELIWEVKLLAEKEKINDPIRLYDDTIKFLLEDFEDATPSMLQDVRAGRKTEVEIFAGEVIRLGKKHNIKTEKNKIIYERIKNLEK